MLSEQEKLVTEPPSEFAHHLRTLREAQGLSIRALAALVGVSSVTIWKWEKGDSKPRSRLLLPLAKALDVSPVALGLIVGANNALIPGADEKMHEDNSANQAEPVGSAAGTSAGSAHPEALADVIARAKQMIAEASGTGPNNITILIEY
jgi:transcriptional regulator with XRE-family HTH domain